MARKKEDGLRYKENRERHSEIRYSYDRNISNNVEGVVMTPDGKVHHNTDLPYNYYAVLCKCGHVGHDKFIPVLFGIKANNTKAAAAIARYVGKVKHDRKDAIIFAVRITERDYARLRTANEQDPYLNAKRKRDQENAWEEIAPRVMREPTCDADGLTAETESFGEGYPLQNYIASGLPYSERTQKFLVEEFLEVNKELWEGKSGGLKRAERVTYDYSKYLYDNTQGIGFESQEIFDDSQDESIDYQDPSFDNNEIEDNFQDDGAQDVETKVEDTENSTKISKKTEPTEDNGQAQA